MTRADRAVKFISNLTLTDEFAGQPMVLYPYQEEIVRSLYQTDEQGKTIIRKCLLLVPRKTSGKTTLAACLAIEHIFAKTKGLACLCAATDRETAGVFFAKVLRMIEADPWLHSQCRRINRSKSLIETRNGNTLQIKSSDGKRAHATNPSMVILDECWTFPSNDLYAGMTSGFGTRTEHLTLMLSTQGNRKDTFLYREYEYACKVRDGKVIDPEYLPIIHEAPRHADWRLESTWYAASPGLKYFGNIESIRADFRKALEIPANESSFKQFHLNILTAADNKWLNSAKWDACGLHPCDPSRWGNRPTWWGVDLSNTSDVSALVGLCRFDDGHFEISPHFWIPGAYARERDRKGQTTYGEWQKQGLIELTEGDEIDYPYIEKRIPEILEPFNVRRINVDPFNATSTTQRLQAMGLPVKKHRQGWQTMSDPIKYTDVLISKDLLHHGDHAVLNWMADNVVVHRDRLENLTFDKSRSADKIDGIVAMVCAMAGAIEDQKRASAYSRKSVEELLGA